MSFTWNGDPAASDLEAVRWEIGDIVSTNQLMQDAEIEYAIAEEETLYGAAARCCEVLTRQFAQDADRQLGPLRVSLSQKSIAFEKLSKTLRDKEISGGGLYAGGLSEDEKDTDIADTDLVQPTFTKNMMNNE